MAPPEPQASKFLGAVETALHGTAHCGRVQALTLLRPGRIDLIWDPAPSRRAGALWDGIDVGVPLIPWILYRQRAREDTCGGRGAELKYRAIHVWKLRWNFGTSGGWGSEGLVNVVGNKVGT